MSRSHRPLPPRVTTDQLQIPLGERLWTEKDWAQFRGNCVRQIQQERLDGSGAPYIKCGRSVRYVPQICREWLAARMVTSTSQTAPR